MSIRKERDGSMSLRQFLMSFPFPSLTTQTARPQISSTAERPYRFDGGTHAATRFYYNPGTHPPDVSSQTSTRSRPSRSGTVLQSGESRCLSRSSLEQIIT